MKTLSNKASSKFHKSVLQQNNPLNTLNDYNPFVVNPVDEANGGVAFICQRFYALVLIKELRLDNNNTVQIKIMFRYIKLIMKLSLVTLHF